jgi:hypothetical protein
MLAKSSLDPLHGQLDIPRRGRAPTMNIARTILAFLIAASVAVLPVTAVAGVNKASAEVSVSEPMHDCCPPDASPCDKAIGDCASMAACALKCFSLTGDSFYDLAFPLIVKNEMRPFAAELFGPQRASPPFRPPRT